MDVDDKRIVLTGEGCEKPVRVYAFGPICEYAGLALGDETKCELEYVCRFDPVKISLLDGRIDSDYKVIFEFTMKNSFDLQDIFNKESLGECIKHFGYYITFVNENYIIYAFPSDFFTNPVPEYQKYSYWYELDLGFGYVGYYFLGMNYDGELFFVDNLCLTEFDIRN